MPSAKVLLALDPPRSVESVEPFVNATLSRSRAVAQGALYLVVVLGLVFGFATSSGVGIIINGLLVMLGVGALIALPPGLMFAVRKQQLQTVLCNGKAAKAKVDNVDKAKGGSASRVVLSVAVGGTKRAAEWVNLGLSPISVGDRVDVLVDPSVRQGVVVVVDSEKVGFATLPPG